MNVPELLSIQTIDGMLRASLRRAAPPSSCVVVMVHPSADYLDHPILPELASQGVDAVGMHTRHVHNDSRLIMEECVLDIGRVVGYLREERGYERVVLLGKSGGGGLVGLYQSQAERPTVTATPSGDSPDLTRAALGKADAVIALMAHPGRAVVYNEWLDPAIPDETNLLARDPDLDLFNEDNGPPFTAEFLARYRAAQIARGQRIRHWVQQRLHDLRESGETAADLPFVVHGTAADPRFIDPTIEPDDRTPGTIWGPCRAANLSPASLGHHTTLTSWLSQWSLSDSNCHPSQFGHITAPVLVIYGTADQVAFPSHARLIYESVRHDDRRLVELPRANHYFDGQPELLTASAHEIAKWLIDHEFSDSQRKEYAL